jgi:hypothetical protein
MKAKHVLYLVIIVGLLVPLSAIPVLADGGIPMWVHHARVAYTGRSHWGPDAVGAFIHIRDANLTMVEGALVSGTWTWTLSDGTVGTEDQQVLTNRQGIAELSVWEGRGEYKICVTGVTKDGWLYDPALNWDDLDSEGCTVFTAP